MGYTIYIIGKNRKEIQDLYKLCKEKLKEGIGYRLDKNKGLSYTNHEKHTLGFDYSSWICAKERKYIFSKIKWMAKELKLDYYVYDSEEKYCIKTGQSLGRVKKGD